MFVALTDIQADLALEASVHADERMVVVRGSFRNTLKTASKIIKYLESKGYEQCGVEGGNQRQGAVFSDDVNRKIAVSVCWGNEVHVSK